MKVNSEIKEVERKLRDSKAERYPNVPAHAVPRRKLADSSANELTKSIIEAVRLHGGFISRVNTVGIWDQSKKIHRSSTTVKGFPDLTGTINGKSIYIEVKAGRDRMSENQLRVKDKIEASGGCYHTARNFDEFYKWLKEEILTKTR